MYFYSLHPYKYLGDGQPKLILKTFLRYRNKKIRVTNE